MKIIYILGVFLLGIIVSLVIFQIYPSPLVIVIEKTKIELISAAGTWAAVAVALFVALGIDWAKKFFYKPDLQIEKESIIEQDHPNKNVTQSYVRLKFINKGNITAEDVEVYVNKIYDDGNERRPFLAVPLKWTHLNTATRNLHPDQFAYLDFCGIDSIHNRSLVPKLQLAYGGSIAQYENIQKKETKIELVVFQKFGKVKKFEIILEWTLKTKHTFKVKAIKEIRN